MEAGISKAIEEGIECLAAGEHEVTIQFLRDGGIEAERRSEVHEIAFRDTDHVVRVGYYPVPGFALRRGGVEDALLIVVEIRRSAFAFDPRV